MNQEDIIRMAREAGMFYQPQAGYIAGIDRLERFAALVAEKACAELCETPDPSNLFTGRASAVAEAIRARGEK
jgi:hypothetical protein